MIIFYSYFCIICSNGINTLFFYQYFNIMSINNDKIYYIDAFARYQPNKKEFMGYQYIEVNSINDFIDMFYNVLFKEYNEEEEQETETNEQKEYEEYKHKRMYPKEIIDKYPNKLNDYYNWIEETMEKYEMNFIISFVDKRATDGYYEFTNCLGTIRGKSINELPDEFNLYDGDNGHYDYSCNIRNMDFCINYILKAK